MFNRRQSQVHGAQFTVSVLSEEEHEASRVTTAEVPTEHSDYPPTRKWSEAGSIMRIGKRTSNRLWDDLPTIKSESGCARGLM